MSASMPRGTLTVREQSPGGQEISELLGKMLRGEGQVSMVALGDLQPSPQQSPCWS